MQAPPLAPRNTRQGFVEHPSPAAMEGEGVLAEGKACQTCIARELEAHPQNLL